MYWTRYAEKVEVNYSTQLQALVANSTVIIVKYFKWNLLKKTYYGLLKRHKLKNKKIPLINNKIFYYVINDN